jgi:hypothetical protein
MLSMDEKTALCKKKYEELANIKLVADKTGIKWQTVYWYLKKAGVEVKGNKAIYGSTKDKFAHKGEEYIQKILPSAINQNLYSFQPKVDFIIGDKSLEIKSGKLTITKNPRWCFSLKKQKKIADYFILLAFDPEGKDVIHHFMIPNELLIDNLQTISITKNINHSKWSDFLIPKEELTEFFEETFKLYPRLDL